VLQSWLVATHVDLPALEGGRAAGRFESHLRHSSEILHSFLAPDSFSEPLFLVQLDG